MLIEFCGNKLNSTMNCGFSQGLILETYSDVDLGDLKELLEEYLKKRSNQIEFTEILINTGFGQLVNTSEYMDTDFTVDLDIIRVYDWRP